jgi:GntR family transcriptional regulator/MocR family aminotransferase
VDLDGLRTESLPAHPVARRLLYLTPSHQFPLGVTLALARRLAVLGWARQTGAWVLEDDYDSEFRYDGRPLAALHALDRAGCVLYVGTCNKVLFPGLRLAYLVLPGTLVEPFAAARRISDGHSPPLLQAALADFMASGQFAAYVRQAREHYAERRDLLVARATRAWGDRVRLGPSSTGLHLVAHLAPGTDDRAIARAVQDGGLGVSALSRYYAGPRKRPGLLLSYGAATSASIARGVDDLTPWLVPGR